MSITTEPKLQLPRQNGILPKAQQPAPTPALQPATASKDSVHFGTSRTSQTDDLYDVHEPPKLNALQRFLHNTPVVKNLYAGIKGGLQGTFEWPPQKYWKGALLLFGITLPLAFLIPGSHFILLPAYMVTRRAIRGISQTITGLTHPDKILNPEESEEV